MLATHDVDASEMATANAWTRITLPFTVAASCHHLAFRTPWSGKSNLDIGPLRVR